jgi:hypothetical protein
MTKKLAFIAIFLCAATVASSEEDGMRIGARVGYNMQNVGHGMGMLGFGAGLVFDIPAGPIFISPEAAFLYRNNFDEQVTNNVRAYNLSQPEYAVSIPVMIKFFPRSSSYLSIGVQIDIPINPEVCFGSDCYSMDGKEVPYERASYDVSIILDAGYRVTSNLNLDFRTIFGVTPHHTYQTPSLIGKIDSDKMYTYGFGISYFFF